MSFWSGKPYDDKRCGDLLKYLNITNSTILNRSTFLPTEDMMVGIFEKNKNVLTISGRMCYFSRLFLLSLSFDIPTMILYYLLFLIEKPIVVVFAF